jgi:hypothetical protein
MRRAAGSWLRAAAMVLMAVACSKPDVPREMTSTSPRIIPGFGVPVPAASADPAAPAAEVAAIRPRDPVEYDGAPLSYTVTETFEAAAVPTVDPDQAIVQAARVSASTCFTAVQDGPDVQSATLEVTVVPSGQVTRTSVSAQTRVREVLDCLTRVGDGLHFSSREDSKSEGIRSFSINVTVVRAH